MFRRSLALLILLASASAYAQRTGRTSASPGTGQPEELVPWKFIEKGVAPITSPVMLYWIPASEKETNDDSPMVTSHTLFEAASRCVGLVIVLPKDAEMLAKLKATAPEVVFTDAHGTITRTLANPRVAGVEHALRDELHARDEAMYHAMTDARRLAATDKPAAIALYRKVWDDRCLFPTAGTEAQHALKELGVIVVEPPSTLAPDPNLKPLLPPKTSTH